MLTLFYARAGSRRTFKFKTGLISAIQFPQNNIIAAHPETEIGKYSWHYELVYKYRLFKDKPIDIGRRVFTVWAEEPIAGIEKLRAELFQDILLSARDIGLLKDLGISKTPLYAGLRLAKAYASFWAYQDKFEYQYIDTEYREERLAEMSYKILIGCKDFVCNIIASGQELQGLQFNIVFYDNCVIAIPRAREEIFLVNRIADIAILAGLHDRITLEKLEIIRNIKI